MSNTSRAPKGVAVPSDLQSQVKALLDSNPESLVVERLGLSRNAVVRLAAGLTVRAGTIAQARAALAAPVDERQMESPLAG